MRIVADADFSEVTAMLEGMRDRMDMQELGPEVADAMREDVLRQFGEGGDPSWQQLSVNTVREKNYSGFPHAPRRNHDGEHFFQRGEVSAHNILIRRGDLLSSWTDRDDPDHIEIISGDEVAIGSALEYAATHQFGRPGGGWNDSDIPARPVNVTEPMADKAAAKAVETISGDN